MSQKELGFTSLASPGGMVTVRAIHKSQSAIILADDELNREIPQSAKLQTLIQHDSTDLAEKSQTLRTEAFAELLRVKSGSRVTAITQAVGQVIGAGKAYQSKTIAERATLAAPVNLDAATITALQTHFLGIASITDRMTWLSKLSDVEISAIKKLPRAIINFNDSEYKRLITDRIVRHNIWSSLAISNRAAAYKQSSVVELFPGQKPDLETLDALVESKEFELEIRDRVIVKVQNLIGGVFSYLQIAYDVTPPVALDKALGRMVEA